MCTCACECNFRDVTQFWSKRYKETFQKASLKAWECASFLLLLAWRVDTMTGSPAASTAHRMVLKTEASTEHGRERSRVSASPRPGWHPPCPSGHHSYVGENCVLFSQSNLIPCSKWFCSCWSILTGESGDDGEKQKHPYLLCRCEARVGPEALHEMGWLLHRLWSRRGGRWGAHLGRWSRWAGPPGGVA